MRNIWIVAADACRARFFSPDKPTGRLQEIMTLNNPQARLHEGDLVSDKSGRDSGRNGSSHGFGNAKAAKEAAASRFASEVCAQLEDGRLRITFGKLYVMGAPAFLGVLRKHQSARLRNLISDEIAKDRTMQTPERIRAQQPECL